MSDFRQLCSDTSCIHNGNQGYYGICNLYAEKYDNMPPIVGMERLYLESCDNREVNADENSD